MENDASKSSLRNLNCSTDLFPLCKMKANNSNAGIVLRQEQNITNCSIGWSSYNGHCYKMFKINMTLYQAQSFCHKQENNSYLADIKTQNELNWIISNFSAGYVRVWLTTLYV